MLDQPGFNASIVPGGYTVFAMEDPKTNFTLVGNVNLINIHVMFSKNVILVPLQCQILFFSLFEMFSLC